MVQVTLYLLLALLAIGLPVAGVMGVLAFSLDALFSSMPLTRGFGEVAWTASNAFLLMSVPLFILLGEILLRSGIADRMYDAMSAWLAWLPGGLMHSNVGTCAVFAATCGSSAATAATVATVALPQMKKHGYSQRLFLGSLASGGTLGILIPPSINMIIYGALTNTSVPKLYLAGIVPGVLLALLFMGVIFLVCLARPEMGGRKVSPTWQHRISTLPDLLPPLVIFLVVIVSIYTGTATATESAALGVLAALALAAIRGRVTLRFFQEVFEGTMKTTAMIMLILMMAVFLNFVMGGIGITAKVNSFVTDLHLSKYQLLLAVVVFYVILGCFMETLSIMVTTLPVITPIMTQAGFDPVWFGIVVIVLIEMALITPPVGVNLYVIQGVRTSGEVSDVIIGAVPFVAMMFVLIALLAAFPSLALFLPGMGRI